MISKERMQGSWNQVVGAVKKEYGQITGDDLKRVEGSVEQLIGLIQSKTGRSREQIDAFLSSCCTAAESTLNRIGEKASEYADYAGEAVRENYGRAKETAQRGYEQTARTVSKRPLESLALVAGAGLLAGLVVGLSLTRRGR